MTTMRINAQVAAHRKGVIIAVLRMALEIKFWGVMEG
jgi:hypothetical protein